MLRFISTPLWRGLCAAVLCAAASHAGAATCEATVESTDAMKYTTSEVVVDKACKKFTVQFKHTGKMPKASMGHNWVLAKTADVQAIANDGLAAGAAADYLKQGDARVIAHSKMLGGGESDTVTIDTSKLKPGEDYTFFCSFPGHVGLMKGKFKF